MNCEVVILRVSIVLPAYNEARALPGLLESLAKLRVYFPGARFLVVDDGSVDGTADVAAGLGAEVVRHSCNLGLGQALLTGLRACSEADVILTMDADGTAGLDVTLALVVAVAGGADLSVASRYVSGAQVAGIPAGRRLLSRTGSLGRLVLGLPVRDCTSGFRAYSGTVLREALRIWDGRLVTVRGPACQLELLWKCLPFAHRVVEVPLVLDYGKRGRSHLRIWRGAAEALACLLRLRTGRRPAPISQVRRAG